MGKSGLTWVFSDADLNILLDRSPAAFARERGWSAGLGRVGVKGRAEQIKKGEKTAFEVSQIQCQSQSITLQIH